MAIQSKSSKSKSKLVVSKKRSGIFDAIASLDSQDHLASKRKQRSTEKDVRQSKAAQSQVEIYQRLVEVRILLQRVMTNNSGNGRGDASQQQELCRQLLSLHPVIEERLALDNSQPITIFPYLVY